jgi:hypothetical protein
VELLAAPGLTFGRGHSAGAFWATRHQKALLQGSARRTQ